MSEETKEKRGNGLINPDAPVKEEKKPKKVSTTQDGLMERQEEKVITEDGRELLTEN